MKNKKIFNNVKKNFQLKNINHKNMYFNIMQILSQAKQKFAFHKIFNNLKKIWIKKSTKNKKQ